jgi:outer membrane protein assembly factor BamB
MNRLNRVLVVTLAVVALVALGGYAAPAVHADDVTAVRLAVVDFKTNVVSVIDAEDGDVLASFGMPGPGSVYGSTSGRWFYVIHTAAGRVSVIDSGLRVEDHGDHQDLVIGAPFVRGTVNTGRRPIDTWVQNGMLTVHNDDDGTLAVFEDDRLEVALDYREIRGAGTGHNNAVVLGGDIVLLSLASAGTVTAYRMDGSAIQTFEGCPGTHGWTVWGMTAAAGCRDGVMLFTRSGDTITMTKVNNPAGTPDNVRVGTLRSNPNASMIVGNWGAGLALIDPRTATMTPVQLPAAPLAFYFTADGSRLIVLTPDGNVHALNPATGQVLGTVAAVAPYVAPAMGQPPVARPGMTVGAGVAYVTNPPAGEIVAVDTTTMTVARRMNVGGTPTSIAMVSATGEMHGE